MQNIKYRKDVDGLRALAVVAVLIFHLFPTALRGGFVGVDVFFVISGFLISNIILNGFQSDTFHFLDFYARRIRRIFPALLLLLVFCSFFSFFLYPDQARRLVKHIAGGAAFLSNFVLWGEAGYFDRAAITKPLLHLWSLGVEEQFYLVWPLLLFLAKRLRFNILYFILTIAALSFLANISSSFIDRNEAFYLPFPRFWELMAGSALACAKWENLRPAMANLLSAIGFILILLAFVLIDENSIFPGWWALLPVMGAVSILAAGPQAVVNRTFFSWQWVVWIGLISYPLYLWHWTLLSFAHIQKNAALSFEARLSVGAASFLLAWLTYKFIESPIRFGPKGKKVFCLAAAMAVTAGVAFAFSDRKPGWFDPDDACLKMVGLDGENSRGQAVFCSISGDIDKVQIALLGDCAANDLYPGLKKMYAKKGVGVINIGNGTCAPFRGVYGELQLNRECDKINEKIYDFVFKNPQIKTVLLGFVAWDIKNMRFEQLSSEATFEEKFPVMQRLVDRDITDLKKNGRTVVVNFDSLSLEADAEAMLHRSDVRDKLDISEKNLTLREPYFSAWRNFFSKRKDVCLFYKFPSLRDGGSINILDSTGALWFRDDHHLSFTGSDRLAEEFNRSGCSASEK